MRHYPPYSDLCTYRYRWRYAQIYLNTVNLNLVLDPVWENIDAHELSGAVLDMDIISFYTIIPW